MSLFEAFSSIEITTAATEENSISVAVIMGKILKICARSTALSSKAHLVSIHSVLSQPNDAPILYAKAVGVKNASKLTTAKSAIELAKLLKTGHVIVYDGNEIIMRAYAADTLEQALGIQPRPPKNSQRFVSYGQHTMDATLQV